LDISVQSLECLPKGQPTAWKSSNKHRIEEEPVDAPNVKWKSFLCSDVNVSDAAAPGDGVVNDNSTGKQMVCDKYCQYPCNWEKYGVSLLRLMSV
jgi:hypothetical protein